MAVGVIHSPAAGRPIYRPRAFFTLRDSLRALPYLAASMSAFVRSTWLVCSIESTHLAELPSSSKLAPHARKLTRSPACTKSEV